MHPTQCVLPNLAISVWSFLVARCQGFSLLHRLPLPLLMLAWCSCLKILRVYFPLSSLFSTLFNPPPAPLTVLVPRVRPAVTMRFIRYCLATLFPSTFFSEKSFIKFLCRQLSSQISLETFFSSTFFGDTSFVNFPRHYSFVLALVWFGWFGWSGWSDFGVICPALSVALVWFVVVPSGLHLVRCVSYI